MGDIADKNRDVGFQLCWVPYAALLDFERTRKIYTDDGERPCNTNSCLWEFSHLLFGNLSVVNAAVHAGLAKLSEESFDCGDVVVDSKRSHDGRRPGVMERLVKMSDKELHGVRSDV